MGTSLNGLTPGATYSGLLKTTDNTTLTSTLKAITDGAGNDSKLQLSTTSTNALGSGAFSTQLGENATAEGGNDIAIGNNASTSPFGAGNDNISIGTSSTTEFANGVIAIGSLAYATGGGAGYSIAIGNNATSYDGISIGNGASNGFGQVVIGNGIFPPPNDNGIMIGNNAVSVADGGTSIGVGSQVQGPGGIAIGYNNVVAQGFNSIAIGSAYGGMSGARADSDYDIAIGGTANAQGGGSVSIGVSSTCVAPGGVAIGNSAYAEFLGFGYSGIAIGRDSFSIDDGTALGVSSSANCPSGIAIGNGALSLFAGSNSSIAIGENSFAEDGGIAIGKEANAGVSEIAFGSGISNAGTVTTETVTSDATWTVKINGTTYKVLLKSQA